jgi:outer membrane immunogenic protein
MKIIIKIFAVFVMSTSIYANAKPISGARIEMVGGYDATALKLRPQFVGPLLNSSRSLDSSGVIYGFNAGYDIPLAMVALGLDAEISGASTKVHEDNVPLGNVPLAGPLLGPLLGTSPTILANKTWSQGRDLYIGGRLTLPVSERFNAYIKAGYTNLRLKYFETQTTLPVVGPIPLPQIGAPSTVAFSTATNIDGIRLGIGGQFTIWKKMFASLEYRYSNYESDVSRNQLVAGFGVRF